MTGYGLAFPHNSKHKTRFNDMLLEYRENGDLERLSRYEKSIIFYYLFQSVFLDLIIFVCADIGCMESVSLTCRLSEWIGFNSVFYKISLSLELIAQVISGLKIKYTYNNIKKTTRRQAIILPLHFSFYTGELVQIIIKLLVINLFSITFGDQLHYHSSQF